MIRLSITLLLLTFFKLGYSQSMEADLALLKLDGKKKDSIITTKVSRNRSLVLSVVNSSLTFYQKFISPQISASCMYETSCSRFSRKSFNEFGFFKGLALTADRITRCNRISASDIHPYYVNKWGYVIDEPFFYKIH